MGYPHYSTECQEYHNLVIDFGGPAPRGVLTLCGSTRFKDAFTSEMRRLTLMGYIVISNGLFGHSGDLTPEETVKGHPVKDMLDTLHCRKIDMSDGIHVINVDGYIGESTAAEIAYAKSKGKSISYMELVSGTPTAMLLSGDFDTF